MHRRRWPDLTPEFLHEISGLLHDVSDFVRFHAVCRPWRISHEPTFRKTTDQFLPWLLTPYEEDDNSINLRCVFSKTGYLAPPPPPLPGSGTTTRRNWVASVDGTAVCYLNPNPPYGPALVDPVTGTVLTRLPLFPFGQWSEEENPSASGKIYDDGTILLYSKEDNHVESNTVFMAALLRPGDDNWTVVKRTLDLEELYYGEFCVAYHAGKILVTVQRSCWHVVTVTTSAIEDDVLVLAPPSMPLDHDDGIVYEYTHVLRSRGELLWASVHIGADYPENKYKKGVRGLVRALSVRVHALEDAAPNPRWVPKKGASLADRVVFLGWPNSFSVDASRLGVTGGCAYFMYDDREVLRRCGVFRHNLLDGTTELVEWLPQGCRYEDLPQGWYEDLCTWLIPQPTIAQTQTHGGRPVSTAPSRDNNMLVHIQRRYGPCFRVFVRNLPLSANITQLRHLFSKHGRVSDAEILCYKKTKRSLQGIGLVTMSTVHDHPGYVLPALNGLVFQGCRLEVVLVKEGRRRRRRRST